MSVSLFIRKAVAGWCLALTSAALVHAQAGYLPSGNEHSLSRALPGDQMHPALSIGSLGGFLAWEDNRTDNDGLGISAIGLDTRFDRVQAPFRVNQNGRYDQERPQVRLLKDGGAVFVWQGGRQSFQQIYARFLTAANAWATGDIMVNSSTNCSKKNADVAVLANGNVVIVWGSFNQRGSTTMQDVYGQMFTPAGVKVGSEFSVNQYSAYNQRTPAIAALGAGGFVVTWVSEQQRRAVGSLTPDHVFFHTNLPSVDVFARAYSETGAASGNEFLVNTSFDVCANPVVAGAPDGSFVIAWDQKDSQTVKNGWDIYGRAFGSADPNSGGIVHRLNTYLRGDQFAPQIAAAGSDYLVAWTSLAQDGSREGVYARFLGADGSPAGSEFRVNTTVLGRQMQPAVAADPAGQFLVAWANFTTGTANFDITSQAWASPGFIPVVAATNYAGPIFVDNSNSGGSTGGNGGGSGAVPGTPPTLDFPVTDTGTTVITNAFLQARGDYYGLFYSVSGVLPVTSGFLHAVTTDRGTYSARIYLAGQSYLVAGRFDSQGRATNQVNRVGATRLTVEWALDLTGRDQLRGRVTNGSWSADLLSDRCVANRLSNRSPYAGSYTMIIPPDTSSTGNPAGSGYGSVTVDAAGKVVWVGTLADGTRVTQSSAVSKDGIWPMYAAPYGGRGLVLSWIQMTTNSLDGHLIWMKSALPGKSYPSGFSAQAEVQGSLLSRAMPGKRMLELADGSGQMTFSGGGLQNPLNNPIKLDLYNRQMLSSPYRLKLSIASSGLFRGTILNPETSKPLVFQGMLLQNQNLGAGFFLNSNLSGQVYILNP
jgi:hypothetical protein